MVFTLKYIDIFLIVIHKKIKKNQLKNNLEEEVNTDEEAV